MKSGAVESYPLHNVGVQPIGKYLQKNTVRLKIVTAANGILNVTEDRG